MNYISKWTITLLIPITHPQLHAPSNELNDKVSDLVVALRQLPGGESLELEKNDLASAAEQELMQASRQIEEAAKRIMSVAEVQVGIFFYWSRR